MKMLKEFWTEEDGIATVEILLILAVLIIIALLFRETIINWIKKMLDSIFGHTNPDDMNQPLGTPTPYPS